MIEKRIIIVGAGKRVVQDALPVIEKLDQMRLLKVYAKHAKKIRTQSAQYEVEPLSGVNREVIQEADLIYLAVSKQSVPSVLKKLACFDLSRTDLLVETPVLLFKHLCHVKLMEKFRKTWVAEDCIHLPCFDPIKGSEALVHGEFDRSAYKYHALALLKTLLRTHRILSAKTQGKKKRTLKFANKKTGVVIEPRDYQNGCFHLQGEHSVFSDHSLGKPIQAVYEKGAVKGFQVEQTLAPLHPHETELMGSFQQDATITSMMDSMKRVGLYRLMKGLQDGCDAYPLLEGLDDMAIDYYLERIGFYWNSPFMNIKAGLGRYLLKSITKLLPGN